ncbi:transcription elongation factor GreB [Motiliproteus sediminis]|uniref:transcription elongation factor GreB n=1 Tax=Motiliproteus sediminis TaxID=1468178 RepID=UPI001AEF5F8F|nr:transcription elongation factor GreB [Motiliproteus sediminis]
MQPEKQQQRALYITPEGEKKLRDELKYLWKVKRPQVTDAVREAAALGDRSENAEYIYGKKQLREIDRRVRYLDKRLDQLTVVYRPPSDQSKVFFGAWVSLLDEQDQAREYRIVGADEIDIDSGLISIDTPLARALLKRQVGDEVEVTTPGGKRWYEITSIRYQPAS